MFPGFLPPPIYSPAPTKVFFLLEFPSTCKRASNKVLHFCLSFNNGALCDCRPLYIDQYNGHYHHLAPQGPDLRVSPLSSPLPRSILPQIPRMLAAADLSDSPCDSSHRSGFHIPLCSPQTRAGLLPGPDEESSLCSIFTTSSRG